MQPFAIRTTYIKIKVSYKLKRGYYTMKNIITFFLPVLFTLFSCAQKTQAKYEIMKTDAEWQNQLTPLQYNVTRNEGTEMAFTGKYWDNHEDGIYKCVGCGQEVFGSHTKFESGTGWPSFYEPIKAKNVAETIDNTLGMGRTEIHCSRCGAHLGHVFKDGPDPTGLRYCINSASLTFDKK